MIGNIYIERKQFIINRYNNKPNKKKKMKKIVFLTVVTFISQMYYMDVFCQNSKMYNSNQYIVEMSSQEPVGSLTYISYPDTLLLINTWNGHPINFRLTGSDIMSLSKDEINLFEKATLNDNLLVKGITSLNSPTYIYDKVEFVYNLGTDNLGFSIEPKTLRNRIGLGTTTSHMMSIGVRNKGVMDVFPDGNGYVTFFKNGDGINPDAISTANKNKYSVFVARGILSEDFAIGPKASWADHVFKSDYNLQNLNEVENYIKLNKRLPEMPSAEEIQEKGYILHDMNIKLLQKVEELTLYTIEQNKKSNSWRKW
jgi:hypothetical protein